MVLKHTIQKLQLTARLQLMVCQEVKRLNILQFPDIQAISPLHLLNSAILIPKQNNLKHFNHRSLKLQLKKAAMKIALPDENAEIGPVPTQGGEHNPEPELEPDGYDWVAASSRVAATLR